MRKTILFAKNIYIKVISVIHADALLIVQPRLSELGHEMYLAEYKNWHRVYTGPFKNQDEANRALTGIKKHISKTAHILKQYPKK